MGGRGRRISEFEASLVYRVSSRTVRAIHRNPVSKTKQNTKKGGKKTSDFLKKDLHKDSNLLYSAFLPVFKKNPYQSGLRIALQVGLLQSTGSYCTGGKSGRSFKGVRRQAKGTTILVASRRLEGHTFQLKRTPSRSSFC